jgi:hypothetical protein
MFGFALRYHPRPMRSFATALLVLAIALPAQAADITGRVSVIDGDTIDIHGQPSLERPRREARPRHARGVRNRLPLQAAFFFPLLPVIVDGNGPEQQCESVDSAMAFVHAIECGLE